MRCPFYQVDAFTGEAFRGNPAAVMVLETWLPDTTLQAIAAENNLSETAFLVRQADRDYQLRWFTPVVEVPLCGHATLASAFVIMTKIDATADEVWFITASGRLGARRQGDMFVLDFPAETPVPCEPPGEVVAAVGTAPAETLCGSNHLFVYACEAEVRSLKPDVRDLGAALEGGERGVIATAPCSSDAGDVVSRFFAPHHGIPEDPVTGSAHCMIVPYWADRLGIETIHALQVSQRGGELHCRLRRGRIDIAGQAVAFIEGVASIPS